ncbi:RYamide neuropeptides-like isoform X2 [Neocloeon triangulifer]|uniref:RYamide neuropeptides-like isoform X2 n=1 Tax=Neocloeon triangulifer TaxID=2078957 RepID=UPI00286F0BF9|nr:RYamide neuropeptides-like isoform X2 [Neocloeon triangulifer]
MSTWKMRLVLSSSLLVFLVATVAESAYEQQFQTFTRYGKRGMNELEGKQLFFTNSRYGKRVPGPMGNMVRLWGGGRPKGNVQPRADKFFINSRYGKRSSTPAQSKEFYPIMTESPAANSELATGPTLICKYTGFNRLYQCLERKDVSTADATKDVAQSNEENQSNE